METFAQHFDAHLDHLVDTVNDMSEDRRGWLEKKLANSLLFGAASSFFFFKTAPHRNEASLNEAMCLRAAADVFYREDDTRLASDIEGICRYYEAKPPVTIERKKGARVVPAVVLANQKELLKRAENKAAMRERIAPDLKGFLDGARYDPFDLYPSEHDADRALIAASRAAQAVKERISQDILYCSEQWQVADLQGDDNEVARWEGELLLAAEDEKLIDSAIKQYDWTTTS